MTITTKSHASTAVPRKTTATVAVPKPLAGRSKVSSQAVGFTFQHSAPGHTGASTDIAYFHLKGVDDFVRQVSEATPMQLVDVERTGVDARLLKDLAKRMDLSASRVFTMFGVPKATAEKKAASGEVVSGSGGQAAIAMAKLLGTAKAIVENSTAKEAAGFDSAAWLGKWLELPQPSLGGRKPADLIDTPTGVDMVTRLLGAIESGAYQ